MKKNTFFSPYRSSLLKDFSCIVGLVICALVVIALISEWWAFHSEEQINNQQLAHNATKIESFLKENFDYIAHISTFMGTQIIEKVEKTNYSKIADILSGKLIANPVAKSLFSWTVFDWATPQMQQVASSALGLFEKPKDISFRHYAQMAFKEPWKLHFDPPSIGIPSKQWIIPTGMGITDEQGNPFGILSMGINIAELSKRLERESSTSTVSFLVISLNQKLPAFYSSDNQITEKDNEPLESLYFLKDELLKKNHGFLSTPMLYKQINYRYYIKLQNYPYIVLTGFNEAITRQKLHQVVIPRLLNNIGFAAISIILLAVMRLRLVGPILSLSKAADNIAKGNLDTKIPRVPTVELLSLARQLLNVLRYIRNNKRIQKKLHNRTEELAHAHFELEALNSQLKELNENLEEKVKNRTNELQLALKERTEFVNNVSHEVRTPVQAITTIAETLKAQGNRFSEQERDRLIDTLYRASQRLFDLIEILLDLSRMMSGKWELKREVFMLTSSIHAILEEFHFMLPQLKPQLTLETHIDPNLPLIYADRIRMEQVWRNIVGNAIKFSHEGTITLRAYQVASIGIPDDHSPTCIIDEPCLVCEVSDEGVGIPEAELEKIFLPFMQSSLTKTGAGGTGMGLSISQEIIQKHGGTIWATNHATKGAIFRWVIPLSHLQVPPTIAFETSLSENTLTTPTSANTPIILMVDDEEFVHTSLELMLCDINVTIVHCYNGEACLTYLRQHADTIKIVFLDMMMPEIKGDEVLRRIRQELHLSDLFIVIQSGFKDDALIAEFTAQPNVMFLAKPYQRDDVLKILKQRGLITST